MVVPDEVLDPLVMIQNQISSHHRLLFEYLKNANYVAFETLARSKKCSVEKRGNRTENDLDYVYPYPLDKTLLDLVSASGPEEFVQFTSANDQEAFVKLILELNANPNKENVAHQRSPLHFAAEAGNAGVLKILLSNHAIKPNLEVARQTALHLAVSNKHIKCVEILLDHNASPNIANSKGLTPTHMAALTAQEAVIKLIFSRSKLPPDIDSFKDFTKRTTRQVLEQKLPRVHLPPDRRKATSDISNLKYYLDRNDEKSYLEHAQHVNMTTEEITDLLKISARHNLPEVVKHLVKQIQKNKKKRAILADAEYTAAERGHHEVLQELFDASAERSGPLLIKACQELGTRAVSGSDRVKCVKVILKKSVNVRSINAMGNTALHYAAAAGSDEIITSLLKAGSYIGHQNKEGISPLKNIPPKCLSRYLDDCLTTETDDTEDSDLTKIHFDYQCFLPNYQKDGKKGFDRNLIEMQPFVDIAGSENHKHLLKHPILSSILCLKWKRTLPVLYYSFLIYSIFYITLIAYTLCRPSTTINANTQEDGISDDNDPTGTWGVPFRLSNDTLWLFDNDPTGTWGVPFRLSNDTLWLFTVIAFIIRAVMQIYLSPSYFLSSKNKFQLSLISLEITSISLKITSLARARRMIDTVVIILATWELVNLIGQTVNGFLIENLKIITPIFKKLQSKYLIPVVPVAFAFFYMMRDPDQTNIYNFEIAHSNTIVMMIRKFNAVETEVLNTLAYILLTLFVFLTTTVLNTLVIVARTKSTKLKGLIYRTKFLAQVENLIVGSPLSESQPRSWYRKFLQLVVVNPLHLLSKSILVRYEVPQADGISIEPLTSNVVTFRKRRGSVSESSNLTLDTHIIENAEKITSGKHETKEKKKMVDLTLRETAKAKNMFFPVMDTLEEILREQKLARENSERMHDEILQGQKLARENFERMHDEIKDLIIGNLAQSGTFSRSFPTAKDSF